MRYHVIEPLGVLYLLGIAKKAGWEAEVVLIKESDFTPLYDMVESFKPDIVGFSIWTGWHVQTFRRAIKFAKWAFPFRSEVRTRRSMRKHVCRTPTGW
jgi:hypothetical protein